MPERVGKAAESVDQREFTAAAGARTGRRSGCHQGALTGFGLHGAVHLAQAAAVRGHTPGPAASPLVVPPFTLGARGRPRRAGVLRPARAHDVATGPTAAGATLASHAFARRVTAAR
nr:HXXEE domain-containing protein [Streptomyces sp. CC210A]